MELTQQQLERLQLYEALLLKWQSSINLVSRFTKEDIWSRHIYDSLELLNDASSVGGVHLDIGSGGGLPAVPLSIVLDKEIICVDSDKRKCIFLREVSRETSAKLTVIESRVEDYIQQFPGSASLITARALAPLRQLLGWSHPLLAHDGVCAFLKGRDAEQELNEARKHWTFDENHRKTKGGGYVLNIQNLGEVRE